MNEITGLLPSVTKSLLPSLEKLEHTLLVLKPKGRLLASPQILNVDVSENDNATSLQLQGNNYDCKKFCRTVSSSKISLI
jgi:hypothetical protein